MTPGNRRARLLRLAHEAARRRGHVLWPFRRQGRLGRAWGAACGLCGMAAWVTPHPLPNETEIAGEAVALPCQFNPTRRSTP